MFVKNIYTDMYILTLVLVLAIDFVSLSVSLTEAQVHLGTRKSGRVFALYNYNAMSDDELNFQVNEELTVVRRGDDLEDEWWWVANKQGIEGYAPRNYLAVRFVTNAIVELSCKLSC